MMNYLERLRHLQDWINLRIDWPEGWGFVSFNTYLLNIKEDPFYYKWAKIFTQLPPAITAKKDTPVLPLRNLQWYERSYMENQILSMRQQESIQNNKGWGLQLFGHVGNRITSPAQSLTSLLGFNQP